jgi:hypothetical protein
MLFGLQFHLNQNIIRFLTLSGISELNYLSVMRGGILNLRAICKRLFKNFILQDLQANYNFYFPKNVVLAIRRF